MAKLDLDAIAKAVEKAKELAKPRKFKQSIELIIVLKDVDVKNPANRLNVIVTLPHKIPGKERKICAIGYGEFLVKAKEAGVDGVVTKEEVEKIAGNKKAIRKLAERYDFFITTPDMMPLIGRAMGMILGPRGKMPEVVRPGEDVKAVVEKLRRSVRIRMRDQPQIMVLVGSEDMDPKQVAENIAAVFEAIEQKFQVPQNIRTAYVKLTMGPPVEFKAW